MFSEMGFRGKGVICSMGDVFRGGGMGGGCGRALSNFLFFLGGGGN